MRLLLDMGLRCGEVEALTVDNVDMQRATLTFYRSKVKLEQTHNIPADLFEALQKYETPESGALIVGTPTLNNSLFPTVADSLSYIKGLKRQNLLGSAFGSHGWSGEGAKLASAMLQEMNVQLVGEPLASQYAPDAGLLDTCRQLGVDISAKLKDHVVG